MLPAIWGLTLLLAALFEVSTGSDAHDSTPKNFLPQLQGEPNVNPLGKVQTPRIYVTSEEKDMPSGDKKGKPSGNVKSKFPGKVENGSSGERDSSSSDERDGSSSDERDNSSSDESDNSPSDSEWKYVPSSDEEGNKSDNELCRRYEEKTPRNSVELVRKPADPPITDGDISN
jgi:hypothetical protein